MSWTANIPQQANWAGSGGEDTTLYITPTPPTTATNPSIGIVDGNEVPLPTSYNSLNVENLTATNINGNPNWDASNWWRFLAKGDVKAELAPINPITPGLPRRQYDIKDFRTLNATNVTLSQDGIIPSTLTTQQASIDEGAIVIAKISDLRVTGPATLDGGELHGTSIGCVPVGDVNTQRIDVLPVGIDITSATAVFINGAVGVEIGSAGAVEVVGGGAAGMAAGLVLTLAGGSHIEYNSDQHYFLNTTNGNDQTTIFVGNVNGATDGTQPLRIVESRGVVIQNATSIQLQNTENSIDWNKDATYQQDSKVRVGQDQYFQAQQTSKDLFPLLSVVPTWNGTQLNYVVGNIVYEGAFDRTYRCLQDVNAPATEPYNDTNTWAELGAGNSLDAFWLGTTTDVVPSTIIGDNDSQLFVGNLGARLIQLVPFIVDDWDGTAYYYPNNEVRQTLVQEFFYIALVENIGVEPTGAIQPWATENAYVINNFVLYADSIWRCIREVQNGDDPSIDTTSWVLFPDGMTGIWRQFTPQNLGGTITGGVGSVANIETITSETIATQNLICPTITTNAINPQTGTSVAITGDLNMTDHNIANVIELEVNSIVAPAGIEMDISATSLNISSTGTGAFDNMLVSSGNELNFQAPNGAMRYNAEGIFMIGSDQVAIATANGNMTLSTSLGGNIELNAVVGDIDFVAGSKITSFANGLNTISGLGIELDPTSVGYVNVNGDTQMLQARFSIPNTSDFVWFRYTEVGLGEYFAYSLNNGTTWIPIASDWSAFPAINNLDMATFDIVNVGTINNAPVLYPFRVYRDVDNVGIDLAPATSEIQVRQTTLTLKANSPYQINMGYSGLVQNASLPSNQQNNTWYFIVRVHPGTNLGSTNIISAPAIFNNTQIGSGTSQAFMTTSGTTYNVRWYIRNNQPGGGVRLTIPNLFANINEIQ